MDDLQLSDPDVDFDSPQAPNDAGASPSASPSRPKPQRAESRYTTEEARDAALRRELDQVRGVNKVIEDVIESLEKAKNNMDVSAQLANFPPAPLFTSQARHARLVLCH